MVLNTTFDRLRMYILYIHFNLKLYGSRSDNNIGQFDQQHPCIAYDDENGCCFERIVPFLRDIEIFPFFFLLVLEEREVDLPKLFDCLFELTDCINIGRLMLWNVYVWHNWGRMLNVWHWKQIVYSKCIQKSVDKIKHNNELINRLYCYTFCCSHFFLSFFVLAILYIFIIILFCEFR